jgi:hypothetical protein
MHLKTMYCFTKSFLPIYTNHQTRLHPKETNQNKKDQTQFTIQYFYFCSFYLTQKSLGNSKKKKEKRKKERFIGVER